MSAKHTVTLLGLLAVANAASAQSVFNGTWRPNPEKFGATRKAEVLTLVDGIYECRSCTPPYKVKADGSDQPIAGNPYYDTLRVTVIDGRTLLKVARKGDRTVAETRSSVSADGSIETDVQTNYVMARRPVEMTTHSTRLAAGPEGSHAISGTWRLTDGEISNHAEDTIFTVRGDTLSMSDRMGRSFVAKLDGTDAPYEGSDEATSVSLKRVDDHTIEESDKKNGSIVKISRWSVSPDGRTMHARFDDTHGHVQEQDGRKVE